MSKNFIEFWNHIPENIDPVLIRIGQFQVRYYGLMYIVAFSVVYLLATYRIKNREYEYSKGIIQNYLIWIIWGLIIGARLGYVLFYNLEYFISHPLEIILPFSLEGGFHYTGIGGMSYHGGLIGVLLSSFLFCRRYKLNFWRFSDFIVPTIPLGYTFGRIGNFLNGELFGRVTERPWGMYFPNDWTRQLRHPSQLYEAFFEGIFLFLVLWNLRKRHIFQGLALSLYLIGYGTVRFFLEFVRQPDQHIGFILGPFTMGQLLCLAMIAAGAVIFRLRKGRTDEAVERK
jgi:phosphatidylglycerol:prolipoprotein diacylglycerol transferase